VGRTAIARSGTLALLAGVAATRGAVAAPPASLQLGVDGGLFYQSLVGWLRDDDTVTLRASFGAGKFVAIDGALSEDLAHLEPAAHLGARVRPWTGCCWRARGSLYFRGDVALVGASHLFSNSDLTAAVGHWGKLSARLGWFVELDTTARIGDYDAFALHVALGVSVSSRAFWR
jgi:hypothetical protein